MREVEDVANAAMISASRHYFGWRVAAAMFLFGAALVGVAISSFVMLAVPFHAEFGWTAAQTGGLVSAMWLTGPLALFLGPVVRCFGPWRLAAAGMLVQVVSLVAAAYVDAFPQMVAVRIFMGCGMVMLVPAGPVIIAQWFRRRFSTAMAIVWSAASAGQMVMGPLTVSLYQAFGWRHALHALALLMLLALVSGLLLARGGRSPAQLGVDVDAVEGPESVVEVSTNTLAASNAQRSIDPRAAAVMSLAAAGAGIATLALQAQAPVLFGALGMSQATAAWQLSVFSAFALLGVIISGWLLDRGPLPLSSAIVTLTVFSGTAVLWSVAQSAAADSSRDALAAVAMALIGYGLGAGEIMWVTLFKRQFGVAVFAVNGGAKVGHSAA